MKTNKQPYIIISILIIGTIILYVGSIFNNQHHKTSEASAFIISIKTDNEKIFLTCEKGCAWKELTYNVSVTENEVRIIDEYGIHLLENISNIKNTTFADFLFKINKTKQGLKLKGIEGTAWVELSFSLAENKYQKIDHLGMLQ